MRSIIPLLIIGPFAVTEEDRALIDIARDILKLKFEKELKVKPNQQLTPAALATFVVDRARAVFDTLFP